MKIVFRSSSVHETYMINYQVQNVQPGDNVRNTVRQSSSLTVSPRRGYILDAKDFIHGMLPNGITSVTFSNSSKRIVNQLNCLILTRENQVNLRYI